MKKLSIANHTPKLNVIVFTVRLGAKYLDAFACGEIIELVVETSGERLIAQFVASILTNICCISDRMLTMEHDYAIRTHDSLLRVLREHYPDARIDDKTIVTLLFFQALQYETGDKDAVRKA